MSEPLPATVEISTVRDLKVFNMGVEAVRLLIVEAIVGMESAKVNHIHRDFVQQAFAALAEGVEGVKLTADPVAEVAP